MILETRGTLSQAGFIHSDAPFPAFVAGYGAGKSHALALRAMRLLIEHKTDIAYYMPTYDLVRLVGYKRLVDLLTDANLEFEQNKSNFTLSLKGFGTVIFRTMDDPDRLVGYEVGHSLLDELDTLPTDKAELVWQRALARNRLKITGGHRNTMAVGTTPEGFRFVYEQWGRDCHLAESKGYVLFKGRTTDNKHLPADYVDNLRDQYPAKLLDAYLNGEFVNMNKGIIQRDWFNASTITPCRLSMGVDLAISLKTGADSSALVIGGMEAGSFHVIHAEAKKATFHEVQVWINDVANHYAVSSVFIEAVQYQLAAVQELMRTTSLPVIPVKPDKDKQSRLMPLAARYEQGFIYHAPANSGNHIKQLEDELVAFPNSAHDDLVDALVYAYLSANYGGTLPKSAGVRVF